MFDDIYYAICFDNGKYYTGLAYMQKEPPESFEIEKASLYKADWQIPKDLYLAVYVNDKSKKYKVVKVKVKNTYEICGNI